MKLTKVHGLAMLITGGFAVAMLTSAHAANVAQFAEQSGDKGGLFTYVNTGSAASIAAKDLPVILTFSSQTANSAPSSYVDALLSITGTAAAPASELAPGIYDESFSSLDLTFTSEANPSDVIFSAEGTGGTLSLNPGLFAGGPTTSILASNTGSSSASLSSPYIDPSLISTDQGIALALTNVNPGVSQSKDGYLNSFCADVTGTFSATASAPVVPEPSPAVAIGLAGATLAGLMTFRKLKNSASAQ